jgi:O-antigen/teichoic acid export membrane protein
MVWILLFDTLSVLPFAKLRQEGRPRKYAFTKATGIFVQVLFTVFFLGICPNQYAKDPGTWWLSWYDPSIDIGYFIIANIIGSVVTFLLLWKELKDFRFRFNAALWKEVMIYSYPLIIVGFGGMINEMMSRVLYASITKLPRQEALHNLGVFGANYKLAVLITIFIQVFRMGAEPFFFNKSTDADAPRTYARITKFFVIVCCFMWLGISLYLDIWGRLAFGHNKEYTEGIMVVPILAMGSLFLGVYYNLSVWYKLTNRNMTGAYITIAGAVITILLNILWIPLWDYFGSAWATFICYAFMMVTSYLLGQKHYRIPYPWKKLLAYITICVLIFFIHQLFLKLGLNVWINRAMATALLLAFALFILKIEKQEFQRLPFIGKYI